MPATARSLEITERYRAGMIRLRKQGQREAARFWRQVTPDDLDGTFPLGMLELTVSTLQREAARLSSAYLSTFIASELGEPERPPALSVWDKTFNGNDLREGLRSAIITAKMAIKDGTDPREATKASRKILVSDVGLFIDTAARESLRQGMEMDDRIVGYQRALKGTCGACSGSTSYEAFSENAPVVPLNVHPHCQCVSEPVVTKQIKTDNNPPGRREPIEDSVAKIESVHRFPPDMAKTEITMGRTPEGVAGQTVISPGGQAKIVLDSTGMPNPATVFHEVGHRIDAALGDGMFLSDRAAMDLLDGVDEMHGVLKAVRASQAYKTLKTQALDARYTRDKQELFARAYAQWIGEKTGVQIGSDRWRALGLQWEPDDFTNISKAMEKLFREKGLLNG